MLDGVELLGAAASGLEDALGDERVEVVASESRDALRAEELEASGYGERG